MSKVQERYVPYPMSADETQTIQTSAVSGFLAVASGTITVVDATTNTAIVNACPVTAGVYLPMPFLIPGNRAIITLAGGAAGTLGL